MIPNPMEKTFIKETQYNSTRLLAVTLAFYLDRSFSRACTMKDVRKCFIIRSKQLSLCIMGRKYLGGSEGKAQLKRKQKSVPVRWPGKSKMMRMTPHRAPRKEGAPSRDAPVRSFHQLRTLK